MCGEKEAGKNTQTLSPPLFLQKTFFFGQSNPFPPLPKLIKFVLLLEVGGGKVTFDLFEPCLRKEKKKGSRGGFQTRARSFFPFYVIILHSELQCHFENHRSLTIIPPLPALPPKKKKNNPQAWGPLSHFFLYQKASINRLFAPIKANFLCFYDLLTWRICHTTQGVMGEARE